MAKIIKHPRTEELFIGQPTNGMTMYAFDGTPLRMPADAANWEEAGEVPCLWDWQADPGQYGPFFALVDISVFYDDKSEPLNFTAGGSIVYIRSWQADRTAETGQVVTVRPISLFASRQVARDSAKVKW